MLAPVMKKRMTRIHLSQSASGPTVRSLTRSAAERTREGDDEEGGESEARQNWEMADVPRPGSRSAFIHPPHPFTVPGGFELVPCGVSLKVCKFLCSVYPPVIMCDVDPCAVGNENLRIYVTSRPEIDIRKVVEPLTSRRVSLHDQSGQKEDIADYVR
jgi:hypothetical protein